MSARRRVVRKRYTRLFSQYHTSSINSAQMKGSKLTNWCNGVIEVGWLAVLVIAPLFMNRFTNWNIEPDKVSLVRSIAVVMLGAFLIKIADGGSWWRGWHTHGNEDERGLGRGGLLGLPLLVPVLLFVVSIVASTLFSVSPDHSIWGGPGRSQGLVTLAAYLMVGLLLVTHLRTGAQLRRIQHAIILPTVPLAIHGLLQTLRWEPVPITGGVSQFRIEATSGNPDFLAAFFIMAAIMTVERIISTVRGANTEDDQKDVSSGPRYALALYGVALGLQLVTIVFTQARGPWIGFAVGMFIFILLSLFIIDGKSSRRYAKIWTLVCASLAGFMLVANVAPQFDQFRDKPFVGRALSLLEHETGSGLVRMVIWEGSLDIMTSDEPVHVGAENSDDWKSVRLAFGYGPEAFGQVIGQYIPPAYNTVMRSSEVTDRAHNSMIDALVTQGVLGVIAYFVLYFGIFYWALRWMGFFRDRTDAWWLLASWLAGAFVMVTIFYLYDGGWRFIGLAVPLGVVAGTVGLISWRGLQDRNDSGSLRRRLFMAGLFTALVAHFIEAQFGITTTATSVYFWTFIGLLYVVGHLAVDLGPVGTEVGNGSTEKGRQSSDTFLDRLPQTAAVDGVLILCLPFIYVSNLDRTEGAIRVLLESLFTRMDGAEPVFGVGFILILTATILFGLFHGRLLSGVAPEGQSSRLAYVGVMLGLWLSYGLVHAARLVPGAEGTALEDQLAHVQGHFDVLLLFLIGWIFMAGWMVRTPSKNKNVPVARHALRAAIAGIVVVLLSLPTVRAAAIKPVHTDVLLDLAKKCTARQDWPCTIELARRALLADPQTDQYAMSFASGLTEYAKQADNEGESNLQLDDLNDVLSMDPTTVRSASQTELLLAADILLRHAQEVNPFQPEHFANVGRLYRYWSTQLRSLRDRQRMQEAAVGQYEVAIKLKPASAEYWREYGQLLAAMGRRDEAIDALRASVDRNPTEDAYVMLARTLAQADRADEASNVAEEALGLMPENESLRQRLTALQ